MKQILLLVALSAIFSACHAQQMFFVNRDSFSKPLMRFPSGRTMGVDSFYTVIEKMMDAYACIDHSEEHEGTIEYKVKVLNLLLGDLYREVHNFQKMDQADSFFEQAAIMEFRNWYILDTLKLRVDSLRARVELLEHPARFGMWNGPALYATF